MRRLLLTLVTLTVGCTDPPPFTESDAAENIDVAEVDLGAIDMGASDAMVPDAEADITEIEEVCDGLGCPCRDDVDCRSDYCIRIGAGDERVCSEICVDECSDPEFECRLLENSGGDAVSLCVPGGDPYCTPCEVDLDCGSTAAACLDQLDGRFCATPCDPDDRCPAGAICGTSGDVAGMYCIPEVGVCAECWDPDDDLFGVGEACAGPDCDQGNSGTFEGAPEACNGRDDNCNSVIDEGYDLRNDPNNCGACNAVCALENAVPICESGVCRVSECALGFANCNDDDSDGCEVDLTDPSLCGVCGPLPGLPGAACGSCAVGIWTCDDSVGMSCEGDPGEEALNACGGCDALGARPFEDCGTCGSGIWVCDGEEALRCVGDDGEVVRNSCGGCAELDGEPETACGTCGSGTWECAGPEEVICSGDAGLSAQNACGGCAPLADIPLTSCGTCDSGEWTCVGIELVSCRGDLGESARNDCGGCDELEESISTLCGPCGDGLITCNGINATLCSGFTPDSDDDTVCDPFDICPLGDDRLDGDGDGTPDFCDDCPLDPEDDEDADETCDSEDICPGEDDRDDADEDGVPDGCDLCRAGADSNDVDGDGTPDACDCDSLACSETGFCSEFSEGAFCACEDGYEGDGVECVDVDECSTGSDSCSEFAACSNTDGGFTCECLSGFSGDGFSCSDIDECGTGTDDCDTNATCENTLSTFTCTCNEGYLGDGRTCTAASTTVSFPSVTDSRSISSYPWMWQTGDYYEGSRSVGLPSTTRLDVNWVISNNSLSCDNNDIDVYLNGTLVGQMVVSPGITTYTTTLSFPPITGPNYTIRYSVNNTVASGCGSMSIDESASTLTFQP